MTSGFLKKIITVITGTLGAQAITLGVMLIVVRLYSPAELGMFNLWLSWVLILSVAVTGRYELALFSVKLESDAPALIKLATLLTFMLSGGIALVVLFISLSLDEPMSIIVQHWLALGLAVMAIGLNKIIASSLLYQQAFKRLGIARVTMAAAIALFQVLGGGWAIGVQGLVYGYVIGALVATFLLFYWYEASWFRCCWTTGHSDLKAVARRYINFPKISLPTDLVSNVASHIPVIFIASRFGAESAGWFALTLKMMGAPITLLAGAAADVFKQQAALDYRRDGNCRAIFIKTLIGLSTLSIVPFWVVGYSAEWAFSYFMGAQWAPSGHYAILLLPMFFMRFIASPLSYTLYISQRQGLDLAWQIVLLIFTLGCFTLSPDIDTALHGYAVGYAALYFIYLVLSYQSAKGTHT